MRILNYFLIFLFLISAALQYNDIDPYLWIPLYFYGAFVCFTSLRGKFIPWLHYSGLAVCIPYAFYLFFCRDGVLYWISYHQTENILQTMKAENPWIETVREFFGLMLLNIAFLANWRWLRHERGRGVSMGENKSLI